MSIEVTKIRQESVGFIAEERLWLASDGKTILRDGDWRAAQLLAPKGGVIPEKLATRLGMGKGVKIEPLQTAPPTLATSPEAIETRETRPEKPSAKR